MNSKEKGNLLEGIVEQLCSGIRDAKVARNAKIIGKRSGDEREIDVLIEGKVGAFEVKIIVEAKNYTRPVGIDKVESLKSKLDDIGGDLGVIACSKGFTKPAKNLARANGIKLYEVFDPTLGNSNLFVPLRCVWPTVKAFSFEIRGRTLGPISIPQDIDRWRFHVRDKILTARQLVWHAWNREMIPQSAGNHIADFNAMVMEDSEKPGVIQYCELKIHLQVIEEYFLKLLPASFLRETESGKEHFNLDMHLYSKEEDMIRGGWVKFDSFEKMKEAAEIENQPKGIKNLLIKPTYEVNLDQPIE